MGKLNLVDDSRNIKKKIMSKAHETRDHIWRNQRFQLLVPRQHDISQLKVWPVLMGSCVMSRMTCFGTLLFASWLFRDVWLYDLFCSFIFLKSIRTKYWMLVFGVRQLQRPTSFSSSNPRTPKMTTVNCRFHWPIGRKNNTSWVELWIFSTNRIV